MFMLLVNKTVVQSSYTTPNKAVQLKRFHILNMEAKVGYS